VLSVEVVVDSAGLRALADQWRQLWARSSSGGLFQSFEYCLDAWELVQQRENSNLVCLAGWRGGRLVAVWPFTTYRNRLWTYARQLEASSVEIHQLLIDDDVDQEEWVRSAWAALIKHSRADVVRLSYRQDGPAARFLGALPGHRTDRTTGVAVRVALRDVPDWDAFYASLSKSHRKDYAKSRRRLEALGPLEFEVLAPGDDRLPSLVEWTLTQKRRWAERTGKQGAWLYSDRYHRFLEHQLAHREHSAPNQMMTLRLGGELLATQLVAVGRTSLDAVIAGFDAEHEKHSPGARMMECLVRWAWDNRLDCELGSGAEPYKTFWSRNEEMVIASSEVAVSWRGVAGLAMRRLVQRWRQIRAGRAVPGPGR